MPNATFFERLGLFVRPHFLDAKFCAACLTEAQASSKVEAAISRHGQVITDPTRRKTSQLQLSATTTAAITEALLALQAPLEAHFEVSLQTLEPPIFYRYQAGDFFGIHKDRSETDAPGTQHGQHRQVSLLLFLNPMSDAANGYSGGALTLYGLLDDPRCQNYGFPLEPEPGLLIGFRSDTFHEVKPVQHGERFTIATWFN